MVDTGNRLSYSINGDSFHITDVVNGKSIVCSNGTFVAFSIDKDVILDHLKNLSEALSSYEKRRNAKKVVALSCSDNIIIREDKHFTWTIGYSGKGATYEDNSYICTRGFDPVYILRAVNHVYVQILNAAKVLNPKRDIVRRISDIGLLVWVYEGHSVVVFEKNVEGACMSNCLVDGNYYDVLLVGTSKSKQKATLFDTDLNTILSFPLDDSILTYYPDGDEMNLRSYAE